MQYAWTTKHSARGVHAGPPIQRRAELRCVSALLDGLRDADIPPKHPQRPAQIGLWAVGRTCEPCALSTLRTRMKKLGIRSEKSAGASCLPDTRVHAIGRNLAREPGPLQRQSRACTNRAPSPLHHPAAHPISDRYRVARDGSGRTSAYPRPECTSSKFIVGAWRRTPARSVPARLFQGAEQNLLATEHELVALGDQLLGKAPALLLDGPCRRLL
jgi:hypothetical protein